MMKKQAIVDRICLEKNNSNRSTVEKFPDSVALKYISSAQLKFRITRATVFLQRPLSHLYHGLRKNKGF